MGPKDAAHRARREELRKQHIMPVIARGGETSIEGRYGTEFLQVTDEQDGLVVLHCKGWRKYGSRRPARWCSLSYLCGADDSGPWAVRVPGTIEYVGEALDWIKPAAVKRAEEAGRTVLRQGDMYVVRVSRRWDARGDYIDGRHEWSSDGRWLLHPEHTPLQVPWPARVYPQKAYQMGRTNRRGSAD
jgi:hypothetical protein